MPDFIIRVANSKDHIYAEHITNEMANSAKARGTGIAQRSPDYVKMKMDEGKAIVALSRTTLRIAGFCYIESWGGKSYVANSGLIVFPEFREHGLARSIKLKAFELSRQTFPKAKLFGLTTSLAVMKINSDLGYYPVTFSELTHDDEFWKGCQSCVNYNILQSKERKNCLCTALLFDPSRKKKKRWNFLENLNILKRLKRIKENTFLSFSKLRKPTPTSR
jgi:hypothetical protein